MADEKKQPEKLTIDTVRFYAAVLTPDGTYTVQDFDTLEELQTKLTDLVDKDVTVFSFAGTQIKVSKPPFRHLLTPWGPKPLFSVPTDNFEEDTTGYLGLDPVHLEGPPQVRVPPAKSSSAGDEFFSDDGDNVTNIFDTILPDPDN